jgi:hypothetical protein
MSASNKPGKERELELFEDALVTSILDASEADTLEAIMAAGEDPVAIANRFDEMLANAQAACGLQRLQNARQQLEQFASSVQLVADTAREASRKRFIEGRLVVSQVAQGFLLAARNGKGATERDLESLASDYAELERLERGKGVDK